MEKPSDSLMNEQLLKMQAGARGGVATLSMMLPGTCFTSFLGILIDYGLRTSNNLVH